MTDYDELLRRFAQGTAPLSAQETEQLCRWAEGQPAATDDIRLLQQISRSRKYHSGLDRFKSDCRRRERRATRWLWPAAAAAALAAVLLIRPADSPQLARTDPDTVKQTLQQEAPAPVAQSILPAAPQEALAAVRPLPRSIAPQHRACETQPAPAAETAAAETEHPAAPCSSAELLLAEAEHEEADFSATEKPQRIIIESRSIVAYGNHTGQSTRQNHEETTKDILGNPVDPDRGMLLAMSL